MARSVEEWDTKPAGTNYNIIYIEKEIRNLLRTYPKIIVLNVHFISISIFNCSGLSRQIIIIYKFKEERWVSKKVTIEQPESGVHNRLKFSIPSIFLIKEQLLVNNLNR